MVDSEGSGLFADVAALGVRATAVAVGRIEENETSETVTSVNLSAVRSTVEDDLPGISEVIRPQHGDTANAVGAALAEVSGETDQVFRNMGRDAAMEAAIEVARARAVSAGADEGSLTTIELEDLPLAYLPGDARRVRARVVGDLRLT